MKSTWTASLQSSHSMTADECSDDMLSLMGGISEHDHQVHSELDKARRWWREFTTLVIQTDEEGLIARLYRRRSTMSASAPVG